MKKKSFIKSVELRLKLVNKRFIYRVRPYDGTSSISSFSLCNLRKRCFVWVNSSCKSSFERFSLRRRASDFSNLNKTKK